MSTARKLASMIQESRSRRERSVKIAHTVLRRVDHRIRKNAGIGQDILDHVKSNPGAYIGGAAGAVGGGAAGAATGSPGKRLGRAILGSILGGGAGAAAGYGFDRMGGGGQKNQWEEDFPFEAQMSHGDHAILAAHQTENILNERGIEAFNAESARQAAERGLKVLPPGSFGETGLPGSGWTPDRSGSGARISGGSAPGHVSFSED